MRTGRGSRSAAIAATAVAFSLLALGCSTTSEPPAGPSGSPSASPSATSASPTTSYSTDPVERPPGQAGFALLTAVRLAGHVGYDRFVVEFDDHVPGYRVEYASKPVIADPSGETVAVAGDHVILVRLEPAGTFDTAGSGTQGYDGPRRVSADTSVVTEAVQTGDFESVLAWVLGVDGMAPFAVSTLQDPARLVIDVQAAG
ncbi:MAG: hypothetical protein GC157_07530 [Frankiales bacterium]|nr:hypothetical protein [Frankiales bacterium]